MRAWERLERRLGESWGRVREMWAVQQFSSKRWILTFDEQGRARCYPTRHEARAAARRVRNREYDYDRSTRRWSSRWVDVEAKNVRIVRALELVTPCDPEAMPQRLTIGQPETRRLLGLP